MKQIRYPWVIVHSPDGPNGKLETILGGEAKSSHGHFGIIIADVIRHVARNFKVDESEVMEWVDRELGRPTSGITGSKMQ